METLGQKPRGYVEVLDKTGRVLQRLPLLNTPLRIGRAYDNDLILDDPYACPHHAEFVWDEEQLWVRDLESLNGLTDQTGTPLSGPVLISSGSSFHAGRTLLRFRDIDHPLAPTLPDQVPLQLLQRPSVLWVIFLATLGAVLGEAYIDSIQEFELLKQTPVLLALFLTLVVWAMLWSFASRVVIHRWNFWRFCGIACLGILVGTLLESLIAYLCFSLSLDPLKSFMDYGAHLVVTATVLFLNLRLTSTMTNRRVAGFATTIGLVLVVFAWGIGYAEKEGFSERPRYEATLKAPFWKISDSESTERFFEDAVDLTDKLQQEIDKG